VNNVTTFSKIGKIINPYTGELGRGIANPHIVYGVHGEYYAFPHIGRYGSVIDFSRGVISEEKLREQFPKRIAHDIVEKEKKRILQKYESLLPDFYHDNESALKAAVEEKFAAVFKVFSAIDMFIFSQGASSMVRTQILNVDKNVDTYGDRKVIESQILPLLDRIRERALETLTQGLLSIFNTPATEIDLARIEWGNLAILRECFDHARIPTYDPGEGVQILDYYSVDNPLVYNVREYENFPPICKLDYIIREKLPIYGIGVANWQKHLQYLQEESIEQKVEKIREHAKTEKLLRRGKDTTPTKNDKERIANEPGFTSEEIYYDT
jgi:hypothetical protein